EEMVPFMAEYAAQYPEIPAWRAPLAFVHSELGHVEEARHELDLVMPDLLHVPHSPAAVHALLAAACASIGDPRRAALLYDRLLPVAGKNVAANQAFCIGAADRYLGLLAATMERWDVAQAHFEAALELNTRMGARPWVAFTQYDYAAMLLARDGTGNRERALTLCTAALDTAETLGMEGLRAKAEALRSRLSPAPVSAEPPHVAPLAYVFRRDGEYWTIEYEGQTVRLHDAGGLRYLAELLHHPGREFHVTQLVTAAAPERTEGARAPSGRALGNALSVGSLGDAG